MKKRDWQILGAIAVIIFVLYMIFGRKKTSSPGVISDRPVKDATIDPNQTDANGKPLKK